MRGTALNVVTVLVGSGIGLAVGGRLPERVRETVLQVLGLFTVVLGIVNAQEAFTGPLPDAIGRPAVLVVLGALLVGAIVGEFLDLDARLTWLGEALQRRVQREGGEGGESAEGESRFVEGFVIASLVFCVGPLTILGSIQDGLSGDYQLLAVKSLLDGFAALAFASGLGVGVAFSAVPVLVVQGAISLLAGMAEGVLTEAMISASSAAGGVLVLAIGLRLLEVRSVRVANLLPALFIAPAIVAVWP